MKRRVGEAPPLRNWERSVVSTSSLLEKLGLVALTCMVLVTLVDVVGDKFFSWPVLGSTEIIGLLQVVAVASGLAYSKIDGRQIYVGFLFDALRGRKQAVLGVVCSLAALAFWLAGLVMLCKYGVTLSKRGTSTFILGIPQYPFVFWTAVVAALPLSALITFDIIKSVWQLVRGGGQR